jgi:hypothetical protein
MSIGAFFYRGQWDAAALKTLILKMLKLKLVIFIHQVICCCP